MKQEEMRSILQEGVNCGFISNLTTDDLRTFKFTIPLTGKEYEITWWINICYLTTSCGAYIPFDVIVFTGTWPNKFKTNMQLGYMGNTCCIVPAEEYPN